MEGDFSVAFPNVGELTGLPENLCDLCVVSVVGVTIPLVLTVFLIGFPNFDPSHRS